MNQLSGNAGTVVAVYCTENNTASARTDTVTFHNVDTNTDYTVTIKQDAFGSYLTVTPTSITFNATGGTATITITSSDDWIIS